MERLPRGDYAEGNRQAWRALKDAHRAGKTRSIGVSNFQRSDLKNILSTSSVVPHVNQPLVHAGNTPSELMAYCQSKQILVQAYSPIAHGAILGNAEVQSMAGKYGVSVPLCIRYTLQLGTVSMPKTANPDHMRSNAEVDFVISAADMAALRDLRAQDYGELDLFSSTSPHRGRMVPMATAMFRQMSSVLGSLRYQPTLKHVRVYLAGDLVADTTQARLVWEPKRVVPSYAVPEADVLAGLTAAAVPPVAAENSLPLGEGPPILDPSTPFAAHTAGGTSMTVVTDRGRAEHAAFRPSDPDLDGYLVLDFDAFGWLEEDEPIIGHPRDPYSRVDVRRSSRLVRVEHDGVVLAESSRPQVLFESSFPMARFYLPRDDVRVRLTPGTARTTCAYKGHATHYDATVGDIVLSNIAWSYEEPLSDATQVQGMISFYQERLDLFVDDISVPRPRTPWS